MGIVEKPANAPAPCQCLDTRRLGGPSCRAPHGHDQIRGIFPFFSFFFFLPLSSARSLSLMLTQRFHRALPDVNIFHNISLVGVALPIWGGKNLQVKLADDMQLELIWSKVLSPNPPSLPMHSTRALACMHARFAKRVARRPELQRLSISVLWRCYTHCCTLIPHSTAIQYYHMSSGIQHHRHRS